MTEEGTHPFGTDTHWSESQKQFIPVATMPLPYARNVLRKLLREYQDEFAGSPLCDALMSRLQPDKSELKRLLGQHGAAAFLVVPEDAASVRRARAMFSRIGKELGVPITTHLKEDFLEATCEPVPVKATVTRV